MYVSQKEVYILDMKTRWIDITSYRFIKKKTKNVIDTKCIQHIFNHLTTGNQKVYFMWAIPKKKKK